MLWLVLEDLSEAVAFGYRPVAVQIGQKHSVLALYYGDP